MSYLPFIERVLREASDYAVRASRQVPAVVKDGDATQIVTVVDRAIGAHLVRRIQEEYPGHAVIEEESGGSGTSSSHTWVVDPIDGTSNFVAGSPHYGVMLGLLVDGVAVAGGVALPSFRETYLAERGGGAFVNGAALPLEPPRGLATALVAYGIDAVDPDVAGDDFELASAIALACQGLRMSNSVYDMMMVARGVYGAFLHRNTRIWDNVAPHVVIEEAGHSYTDLAGVPISYEQPLRRRADRFTVCAASRGVREALGEIIGRWSSCRAR